MQIPSFLFADTRDVCLRCCFLRDETLFRVAAPCGFFYSLRKPFLPACMKTAVLSTAASLFCVINLLSRVLDVCLRCCFLRDETLFRVAAPCGFFYSLRKPFLPACMKTAVLSTAASLFCVINLLSRVLDVCLRCCFLRDETLFRVAAPCGFFYSLRKPFLPACMKTAVLSTAASLFCVINLLSRVLDVCLRCCKTCDRHSEGGARHVVKTDFVAEFD